jgi:hypothetical protein
METWSSSRCRQSSVPAADAPPSVREASHAPSHWRLIRRTGRSATKEGLSVLVYLCVSEFAYKGRLLGFTSCPGSDSSRVLAVVLSIFTVDLLSARAGCR